MKTEAPKKWTAKIEFDGRETIDAEPSRWDTLKETTEAAIREATEYLQAGLASEARIELYKRLKGDAAPKFDRSDTFLYTDDIGVWIVR